MMQLQAREHPKIANKPPGARRVAGDRYSLTVPGGKQPCQHLDLRLLASRTARLQVSVKPPALCYVVWQPQETKTMWLH